MADKAKFKPSDFIEFEVEGGSDKEFFEKFASLQEVFADEDCGVCKSKNTRFRVRDVDGNNFYERLCQDCSARLAYGQNKTGGSLFPKRKIGPKGKQVWDNKTLGWSKYSPETTHNDEEATAKPKAKY